MQTILGSTGAIGTELAKALTQYTHKIRLVSRNPKKVNAGDETMAANLLDAKAVDKAVEGSEVVYLTAGITYSTKVWEKEWPVIMKNVVDACVKHNAKLVFFSNVYPLGLVKGKMTEETPVNPHSEKGKIRANIEKIIWDAVEAGKLKAIIARAADFYGPDTNTSFVNIMVIQNLAKGKSAMWMVSDKVKHTFTYTPDAGKATAILGNTENAWNQVWHLPTDQNALTGEEFIKEVSDTMGVKPKYTVLKPWMLSLIGIFNKPVKENMELLYQFREDYLFDSSKFEKDFNFKPTPYSEGIKTTVNNYQK